MPSTIIRSIGTKTQYATGTIAVNGTGLIITLSGGSFDTGWVNGDKIVIDTGGTPETLYVLSRDSTTQLTLQSTSTKINQSGLAYTLDRGYATVALWVAGAPASLTTADQIWKGEMYKDADFTEENTVIGGSHITDATRYFWLTTGAGQKHTGLAGTGVRWKRSNPSGASYLQIAKRYTVVENIEFDGARSSGYNTALAFNYGSTNSTDQCVARNLIIHGFQYNAITISDYCKDNLIDNCLIYNNNSSLNTSNPGQISIVGPALLGGIRAIVRIYNCTLYLSSAAYGIGVRTANVADWSIDCRNTISMNNTSKDFDNNVGVTWTSSTNNMSSDTTASGTGANSQISKVATNQFINIGGNVYTLKTGADAIGNATNLSVSETGYLRVLETITTDIIDILRTVPWDIGCFKYISSTILIIEYYYQRLLRNQRKGSFC